MAAINAACFIFGGFYSSNYGNVALNGAFGCPPLYNKSQVLGQYNVDFDLYQCVKPVAGGYDAYSIDFGGMYGAKPGGFYSNPIAGTSGCPPGYTKTDVFSRPGIDYALYYCWKPHTTAEAVCFGGAYGQPSSAYINPLTLSRSCPSGYTSSGEIFGTVEVDWPVVFCYKYDVNECALRTHDCPQLCNNTGGGWTCSTCGVNQFFANETCKPCPPGSTAPAASFACTAYCPTVPPNIYRISSFSASNTSLPDDYANFTCQPQYASSRSRVRCKAIAGPGPLIATAWFDEEFQTQLPYCIKIDITALHDGCSGSWDGPPGYASYTWQTYKETPGITAYWKERASGETSSSVASNLVFGVTDSYNSLCRLLVGIKVAETSFKSTDVASINKTTICDCLDVIEDNGKPSLSVSQQKGSVSFRYQSFSFCATTLILAKSTNYIPPLILPTNNSILIGDNLPTDINSCQATPAIPVFKDDISPLGTNAVQGSRITYCLFAKRGVEYITVGSGRACSELVVAFYSTIRGTLRSKVGTELGNIIINYVVREMPNSTAIVSSGQVKTNTDGTYMIEIQTNHSSTGAYDNPSIRVDITPTYGDPPHVFICEGGDARCPKDPMNSSITVFPAIVYAQHQAETTLNMIDISVWSVSGVVSFANTAAISRSGTPCTVANIAVCPMTLDNLPLGECGITNIMGEYVVSVQDNVQVKLVPKFGNHTFNPPSRTLIVTENVLDQDFEDTLQSTVEVSLGGCQGTKYIGEASFILTSPYDCPDLTVTQATLVPLRLSLPPVRWSVKMDTVNNILVREESAAITEWMDNVRGRTLDADLRNTNNLKLPFEYRPPIKIDVTMGDDPRLCNGHFVALQKLPVNITLDLSEDYGSSGICRRVKAAVTMWDSVTDRDICPASGCKIDVPLVDVGGSIRTRFVTTTVPGVPQTQGDMLRDFKVEYIDPGRVQGWDETYKVYVTGDKFKGSDFSVTLSDAEPLLFLYDPPGGKSYAQISKGTSISQTFSTHSSSGFGGGAETSTKIGPQSRGSTCVGFGALKCFDENIESLVTVKTTSAYNNDNSDEFDFEYKVTFTETIQTSQFAGLPGRPSDVVVTTAISLKFALYDVLNVKWENGTCQVGPVVQETRWSPDVTKGYSVKSINEIENYEMPTLLRQINNTQRGLADPERDRSQDNATRGILARALQGYAAWKNILTLRDARAELNSNLLITPEDMYSKVGCKNTRIQFPLSQRSTKQVNGASPPICDSEMCYQDVSCDFNLLATASRNSIFFSGGGTTYSLDLELGEQSRSQSTKEYDLNEEFLVGVTGAVELFGLSSSTETLGKVAVTQKWGSSSGSGTGLSSHITVVLGDDDPGDKFDVTFMYDKTFRTPFFSTLSGRSMCPWEPKTVAREAWNLRFPAGSLLQPNVPPDQPAVFHLFLENNSPTDETMTADFLVDLSSNPQGLKLKLNDAALTQPMSFTVNPTTPVPVTLEAYRPFAGYLFDNVVLNLRSPCEAAFSSLNRDIIQDTAQISVHFIQPCSTVEWAGKMNENQGFTVKNGDTEIVVEVKNPYYLTEPWSSRPDLEVTAQYRRKGDLGWTDALTTANVRASFALNGTLGFTELKLQPPIQDETYELRVLAYCNSKTLGQQSTSILQGVVDRVKPAMFGRFAQPADGVWFPGDAISVRFMEKIDCRKPYTFSGGVRMLVCDISQATCEQGKQLLQIDSRHLHLLCTDDTVEIAFDPTLAYAWDELVGRRVTVYMQDVRDLVGNSLEGLIYWSFEVAKFNLNLVAVQVTGLRFTDLDFVQIASKNKFIADLECEIALAATSNSSTPPDCGMVSITDVRAGSVIVDFKFSGQNGTTATQLSANFAKMLSSNNSINSHIFPTLSTPIDLSNSRIDLLSTEEKPPSSGVINGPPGTLPIGGVPPDALSQGAWIAIIVCSVILTNCALAVFLWFGLHRAVAALFQQNTTHTKLVDDHVNVEVEMSEQNQTK